MKLDTIQITNFTNGYISKGAISESQFPLDAVTESMNFDFDQIGAVTLRKGTTLLGNQVTSGVDILGLYEFRDSGSGTNNQVLMVKQGNVYYLNSGSWSAKRTVTSGYKANFTTFLDYIFMVNGIDATMTWNGDAGSSFGTVNAESAPIGNYIETFRSRIWIANSTDRLYYSNLPSAEAIPTISWNNTVNYIDISPQDGDNITGLKRYKNALLLFKREHIYRVYSTTETEPDPKISVGTYSGRSIVEANDGVYFHHPSGIYKYLDGGITCISEPIIDFIKNITVANYSKIAGWQDGNHVYFSVGDVVIGDVNYSNVVLRYTISSKVWTFRSYPTQFLASGTYNDGTTIYNICGDDDGNVLKLDTGYTDNGSNIFYSLTTKPYTLDGLFSTRKHISKMAIMHSGAEGSQIGYCVDDYKINKIQPIAQVKDKIAKPFTTDIKGNKIWFNIKGSSSGNPFTFYGFEILDVSSELIG
jgi:hypothetical protein